VEKPDLVKLAIFMTQSIPVLCLTNNFILLYGNN